MNRERWQHIPEEIRIRNVVRQLRRCEKSPEDPVERDELRSLLQLMRDDQPAPEIADEVSALLSALNAPNDPDFFRALVQLGNRLGDAPYDHEFLPKIDTAAAVKPFPLILTLCDLRSAFNVGAIFRTAECIQCERLDLCGYTATPDHPKLRKTAMGADQMMPWRQFSEVRAALAVYRGEGRRVYALEVNERAENVFTAHLELPAALLLGNEALGLDPAWLEEVDGVLSLPQYGRKLSLNVGTAAAVAGYVFRNAYERNRL